MTGSGTPLLEVDDLKVSFAGPRGRIEALNGMSLALHAGETLGIAGESGSGKSTFGKAILNLLPKATSRVSARRLAFKGQDLLGLPERRLRRLRGAEIAMIFQEPQASLDPVFTIGQQMIEAIRMHRDLSTAQARNEAVTQLQDVGIADPETRLSDYPHNFSGGMCQRVMIAMAMSCRPQLIIADEPTTALDVTVQAQIIRLLVRLQRDHGTAIVLITHNLALLPQLCERALVVYAGKVVEEGPVAGLLARPVHPYTEGLLRALPRLSDDGTRPLPVMPGRPPDPADLPRGCSFHPRCPRALELCADRSPQLDSEAGSGRRAACFNPVPRWEVEAQ